MCARVCVQVRDAVVLMTMSPRAVIGWEAGSLIATHAPPGATLLVNATPCATLVVNATAIHRIHTHPTYDPTAAAAARCGRAGGRRGDGRAAPGAVDPHDWVGCFMQSSYLPSALAAAAASGKKGSKRN